MNIHKMISDLQAEKQLLDEAIGALERLSAGTMARHKRRSKPLEKPLNAQQPSTDTDVPHTRPH